MSQTARTKPFLISYHHAGAKWGLTIHARDHDDCRAILKILPLATIDGELIATIPAAFGGHAVPFVVWLRNKLFGART